MLGPESRAEIIDQRPPFIIRAHHLFYFAWLVNQYDATPQRLARRMISWTKSSLGYILNSPESQRKQKEQEEKEYEEDVLGVDLEHADKFEEHLVRTFEEFLRLPNNHPAEILVEMPDIICAGCAVGNHCRRTYINDVKQTDDSRCMDAFLKRVDSINWLSRLRGEDQLPELTILKNKFFFPDTEPPVEKINTTLGVVKKVLTRKPNEKSILFRSF